MLLFLEHCALLSYYAANSVTSYRHFGTTKSPKFKDYNFKRKLAVPISSYVRKLWAVISSCHKLQELQSC